MGEKAKGPIHKDLVPDPEVWYAAGPVPAGANDELQALRLSGGRGDGEGVFLPGYVRGGDRHKSKLAGKRVKGYWWVPSGIALGLGLDSDAGGFLTSRF
jgi:hypothetical protein